MSRLLGGIHKISRAQ